MALRDFKGGPVKKTTLYFLLDGIFLTLLFLDFAFLTTSPGVISPVLFLLRHLLSSSIISPILCSAMEKKSTVEEHIGSAF